MTNITGVSAQTQQTKEVKIEIASKKGDNKYTSVWQGLKAEGYSEQEINKIDSELHKLDKNYNDRKVKDGTVINLTDAIKAAGYGDRLEIQTPAAGTNNNPNGNSATEPQAETPSQAPTAAETTTLTPKEQVDKAENVLNFFKECDGRNKNVPDGAQNSKVSKQELYIRTATDKGELTGCNIDDLAKQNEFFDKYDKDKDGELTFNEFENMCDDKEYVALAKKLGVTLEGPDLKDMMKRLREEKDAFENALKKKPEDFNSTEEYVEYMYQHGVNISWTRDWTPEPVAKTEQTESAATNNTTENNQNNQEQTTGAQNLIKKIFQRSDNPVVEGLKNGLIPGLGVVSLFSGQNEKKNV